MKVFFQDKETEDVLHQTDDCSIIPNVGESIRISKDWYDVVERTFYYRDMDRLREFSCTIWVKPCEKEKSLWHNGSEKPNTGRIFYESEEEDGYSSTGTADYDREKDQFFPDIETYYSGPWGRCHIKRWIYEQDILNL